MKKAILYLCFFMLCTSCYSQQTIVPMKNTHWEYPDGSYLKDTDGFLDSFVGTWQYQNGNEQLILIIKKELKHFFKVNYKDILYGEYKYVNPSGETLVNTLDKIDYPYTSKNYHKISGARFIENNRYVKCNDCNPGEFRVKSSFSDPDRPYINVAVIFRYINPTTIKVRIYRTGMGLSFNGSVRYDYPQVPIGEYTMTKQ